MNVIVFDLETTGTDTETDEIIQIGAVCMSLPSSEEGYKHRFEVKIKPSVKGHASLVRMWLEGFRNSYDAEVWEKDAVSSSLGLQRFVGWLGRFKDQNRTSKAGKNYMVVQGCGYNAAKFDHPFLLTECRRHGIFMPMDMRCWDTMQFAMFMFQAKGILPVDYKLATIAETLGIELVNAHDALSDVIATAEITKKLFSMV